MAYSNRYIAGFFDGEGCIGIYSRKQRGYHLRTQLSQNKGKNSEELMKYLLVKYGGNLSEQIILSNVIKYNWQLNADNAVLFLEKIVPFLALKKEQALIAIWWQKQRPERIRNKKGQIVLKRKADTKLDENISRVLKQLKTKNIEDVMENSKEKVKHTLKQVLNVKGD